jgi:hypothetical protein
MTIDKTVAYEAAEKANRKYGQWMPQRWLDAFIEAYAELTVVELAWDHSNNRSYEPVETRAKEIYDAWPYNGAGGKPGWVPRGNSVKQDEARELARRELRLMHAEQAPKAF